jgi:hypothetical protein
MKLEEICGYLPYELEGVWNDVHFVVSKFSQTHAYGKTKQGNNVPVGCFLNKFKPILRPLSNLNKPCLPDGKIPIVELLKIADCYSDYPKEKTFRNQTTQFGIYSYNNGDLASYFEYVPEENTFNLTGTKGEKRLVHNQLQLFQKLYELKMDLFGLIKRGKAININTLP